ncbi:MAG: DNA primase [Chlamydiae bacterium]|nr:DNA primase [Chlamydiota bacterium]
MPIIAKESLENVKKRVDLVDVIESYVDLKRSGASYKGLCPFHEEKSPSFMIQKGDSHYHCFGCGAHGDAIQFLMEHQSMGFVDAVEMLAEKYQVHLEHVEEAEEKGPPKKLICDALEEASLFFQAFLLHTENGNEALQYLYQRGISLEFIQKFGIGYAPKFLGSFLPYMRAKKFTDEILLAAGLLRRSSDGKLRDFFSDRITFPIHNAQGRVIGFSARKFHEETFGGKYVNSVETPVFKKSRTLYGLNFCRRRIAKERQAVIVEGQIDCLRLIFEGVDIAVAGQGTAFGEGHVQELLNLGVNRIYLALDSDLAGREATVKIGNMFQKAGVGVFILKLPQNSDPDDFVQRKGIQAFLDLMDQAVDYLPFLVDLSSHKHKSSTPAEKNELVYSLASQIRGWDDEVMVHESLKLLAKLTQVPEEMVLTGSYAASNVYVQGTGRVGEQQVDPHLVLESDFLRWLLLMGGKQPQLISLARNNVQPEDLKHPHCRQVYGLYMQAHDEHDYCDWMALAMKMEPGAQQLLSDLHQKLVNKDKAEEHFEETVQKILDRNWMDRRELVRVKIQSGNSSEDELFKLLKIFDALKSSPPQIKKEAND